MSVIGHALDEVHRHAAGLRRRLPRGRRPEPSILPRAGSGIKAHPFPRSGAQLSPRRRQPPRSR